MVFNADGRKLMAKRIRRPPEVTMIALFQFLKAGLLAAVTVLQRTDPSALLVYPAFTSISVFIASHGKNPESPWFPLYAITVAWMGVGLWRMRKWSRYSIMITSSVTVGLYFYTLQSQTAIARADPNRWLYALQSQANLGIGILVCIDVLIFGYLAAYPDIRIAFAQND
jgi:hypothetical protein